MIRKKKINNNTAKKNNTTKKTTKPKAKTSLKKNTTDSAPATAATAIKKNSAVAASSKNLSSLKWKAYLNTSNKKTDIGAEDISNLQDNSSKYKRPITGNISTTSFSNPDLRFDYEYLIQICHFMIRILLELYP